MNTRTQDAHLNKAEFELLPLASIAPSETPVQAKRRASYTQAAIDELAVSLREQGLLQPIVVRPLETMRDLARYELVAGERRWLAAEKAGHAHILARIIAMTDDQVIAAQLVENLQRQGLDTLAEAQGYRDLMDKGVKAEAIGDIIGKSRSYVYARVQLLQLAPAVQDALKEGSIDASQALLFARIPEHKLQEQALKTLERFSYSSSGEHLSFRRTADIFAKHGKGLMLPLSEAPWLLTDETFHTFGPKRGKNEAQDVIPLPACVGCVKRSGNDAELLAAVGDPNLCADRECYGIKHKITFERRRHAAAANGQEILSGEAAEAIMPSEWGTKGWLDLDEECQADEFPEPQPKGDYGDPQFDAWLDREQKWKPRTYRQLLGDDVAGLELKLVQDPRHKSRIRELAPDKEIAKRLKAKGFNLKVSRDTRKTEKQPKPLSEAQQRRAEEKAQRQAEAAAKEQSEAEHEQRVDEEYQRRLLVLVHQKAKGALSRDDLEMVAEFILEDYDVSSVVELLFGSKRPSVATMGEKDLGRLVVALLVGREYVVNNNDRAVVALAKRLKLDAKALKKEVRAELTLPEDGQPKKPAKKSKRK